MATERIPIPHKDELPSERDALPLPDPGTEDAAFLASLNAVYGEDPNPEDERLIAGMHAAFRRVLERDE
jgi:hypothetical protein